MDRTESASIQVDSAKFVFDTRDKSLLDPPQSTFVFVYMLVILIQHLSTSPEHLSAGESTKIQICQYEKSTYTLLVILLPRWPAKSTISS
jgi:hypothetical protein